MLDRQKGLIIAKWLQQWIPWIIPKIPLVVAAATAAYYGFISNWGTQPLPTGQMMQGIFTVLIWWFTSEGLEVIVNRWRNTNDQIKDRLEQLEGRMETALDEMRSQWGKPISGVDAIVKGIDDAIGGARSCA